MGFVKCRRGAFFLAFLLIMLLASTCTVYAREDNPKKVSVGMYILNLGKFDVGTGSFTVDFYLSLKCEEECPKDMNFEFMNGRAASIDKQIDKDNEKFYRIQANLNSPVDLKKYPFDSQQIQIIFEDKVNTIKDLEYSINEEETGIDHDAFFTGWEMGEWKAEVKEHYYNPYNETYSQYIFTMPISRVIINSIIKTLLPVVFIILVMMTSFILDPDKLTTRISMVGSALVASVMFHISITNQIPPVGYLTFADKFMVLTYFIILLSFILNVWMFEMQKRNQTEKLHKVYKSTEYSMIFLTALMYFLLFIIAL